MLVLGFAIGILRIFGGGGGEFDTGLLAFFWADTLGGKLEHTYVVFEGNASAFGLVDCKKVSEG